MCEDIFVDRYKKIFKKIEELKPYLVKFGENSTIKPEIYLFNCEVGENN